MRVEHTLPSDLMQNRAVRVLVVGAGGTGSAIVMGLPYLDQAMRVWGHRYSLWCSNLAITQEEMRQVHLGKRLDESVLYSQRTYELDAETTVSALRDVIGAQLNADALRRRMDSVRQAHEQNVDAVSARDLLRKTLLKAESDAVIEAYNSPDTHNLPAGNTTWRLSNAISWVAGNTGDPERKLELMKFAGEVLPVAA